MDPVDELKARVTRLTDDCQECREDLISRCSHVETAMAVLTSRYESVERLVYAFCGTVLLAALVGILRVIGWKP